MLKIKHSFFLPILLLLSINIYAQNVGIGTTTPDVSALLHVNANNKGLLIPKVSLASLTDAKTVDQPANGLLIFNINAAITGGTGFYYNSGTTTAAVWEKFQTGATSGGGWGLSGNAGTDSTLNFIGTRDAKPLVFRVGNGYAGQIGFGGGISLGKGANGLSRITPPGLIAIGDSALYNNLDSFSIAIGSAALYSNTTGTDNTAIGIFALSSNQVANDNTGIGYAALASTQTDENTAVGSFAMAQNLSGIDNAALGYGAMNSNDNGYYNTAVGALALVTNTTADYNTAIGAFSLFSNATGMQNTALGSDALATLETGNFNTAVGDSADVSTPALSNTTTVGYRARATANNQVRVGNTAVTSIGGSVNWSVVSDGRYKKDLNEDVKGLDFIMQLRPVTYHYSFDKLRAEEYVNLTTKRLNTVASGSIGKNASRARGAAINVLQTPGAVRTINKNQSNATQLAYNQEVQRNDQTRYTGFVAQEVEAAALKAGYDFSGIDKPKNATDHYALRYAEFVVPLVKAMQEQQTIIDAQNKKIDELTKRLEKIEQQK